MTQPKKLEDEKTLTDTIDTVNTNHILYVTVPLEFWTFEGML
jgi:hypothetical protein